MKAAMSTLIFGFLAASAAALPADGKPAVCTTTISRLAQLDLSPTTTIYAMTSTATSTVNCHGCGVVAIKSFGGPGPVRQVTATVTKPVTTTTTTICSPSIR